MKIMLASAVSVMAFAFVLALTPYPAAATCEWSPSREYCFEDCQDQHQKYDHHNFRTEPVPQVVES